MTTERRNKPLETFKQKWLRDEIKVYTSNKSKRINHYMKTMRGSFEDLDNFPKYSSVKNITNCRNNNFDTTSTESKPTNSVQK